MNKEEYKKLAVIFLIAASLRILLFTAACSWDSKIYWQQFYHPDSGEYHSLAINLLENNIFSYSNSPPYTPDIRRTPVYPLFISLFYAIFGYKLTFVIFFQIIVGALTCILVYRTGTILFSEKAALLASIFFAFEYSNILYSNQLFTETLFTALFIIHVYFLIKFLRDKNSRELMYSALFLGFSTLCRPVSSYFFVFLVGTFAVHYRNNVRDGIIKYSFFVLVFLLTVTPWMVRNYIVSGKFLVSSLQVEAMQWYPPRIIQYFAQLKEDHPRQLENVQNESSDTFKSGKDTQGKSIINALQSDTKRYIDSIFNYFTVLGSSEYFNILNMPHHKMSEEERDRGSYDALKIALRKKSKLELFFVFAGYSILLLLYSTMCFGVFTALKKRKFTEVILLVSILAYFAIASSTALSHGIRYRVPIMPYIILISSYGITQLQRITKSKQ